MNLLCRKYVRFFIALLMITALHGEFIICTAYEALASKYVDTADNTDLSTQDSETEDSAVKGQKKTSPDLESETTIVSIDRLFGKATAIADATSSSALLRLYEKVPTQPPLLQIA